ncbi:hypothetical protein J1N35_040562, partial [Gossypium stocksii]
MGALDLCISDKFVGKIGFHVSKSTKTIKTVNSEEVSTVRVAHKVEPQINEWKGKEDFE